MRLTAYRSAYLHIRNETPKNRQDLTGKRFERLVAICPEKESKSIVFWKCKCDCGNIIVTRCYDLLYGSSKSCGCLSREITSSIRRTHGETVGGHYTKEYIAWAGMIQRCTNKNELGYKNYGARGITVCSRWLGSFELFLSDMGRCPSGMSLDRINNEKGYSPDNCRWATKLTQANNTRSNRRITYNGITQTLAEWSRQLGFKECVLRSRLNRGWPIHDAITTPNQKPIHQQ